MNFNFDEISRDIPEITGMPARWMRDIAEVKSMRQQQQQAVQERQYLEAAPVLAKIRQTELETQQMAQAGPAGRI